MDAMRRRGVICRDRRWRFPMWVMLAALGGLWLSVTPETAHGCYAVVVGRDASVDGSVLLGHNEQSGATLMTNLRVVPAMRYARGQRVYLLRGGTLEQVEATGRAIWSNIPGQEFSDNYLNQWGVAVVSDGCPTREDGYDALVARGEIRAGGIGFMLRRLIALRAHTAREGVALAGRLLDRFGYTDTGRTLVIADPREAWLLSMVRGRHWVARRVPDDHVVILPNVHVITEVDLADTANFRGAPDLVDYATARGWFDPRKGRAFSFRAAYNRRDGRDPRQWRGQCLVASRQRDWPAGRPLPFALEPDHKLSVADVLAILKDHNPGHRPLCNVRTEEGAVFQLRDGLPVEIGAVYWRISAEPCMGLLVPWYSGIRETPGSYYEPISLETQLDPQAQFQERVSAFTPNPALAWWVFTGMRDLVHEDYAERITGVRPVARAFAASLFAHQSTIEAEALAVYDRDPEAARSFLTEYSGRTGRRAEALARRISAALRSGLPMPTAAED